MDSNGIRILVDLLTLAHLHTSRATVPLQVHGLCFLLLICCSVKGIILKKKINVLFTFPVEMWYLHSEAKAILVNINF